MDYASAVLDFERATADLPTGTVTYFATGQGAPVLYLHGRGGLRKSVAQKLIGEKYRLFLPVHPGFDGTAFHAGVASMRDLAALYAEFIDAVIGGPCDVIGHSFGGWLAAWLAVGHGDRVRKLVLECPAGFRPGGAPSTRVDNAEVERLLYAHPERLPPDDRPPGTAGTGRRRRTIMPASRWTRRWSRASATSARRRFFSTAPRNGSSRRRPATSSRPASRTCGSCASKERRTGWRSTSPNG